VTKEELEPKRPFYDKDGRVRDERIAEEMALSESYNKWIRQREPGATADDINNFAQRKSEETGLRLYQDIGVEIKKEEVPRGIFDDWRASILNKDHIDITDPDMQKFLEFRKIERPDAIMVYSIEFYRKESDTYPLWSISTITNG